jgi:hypothetical protein
MEKDEIKKNLTERETRILSLEEKLDNGEWDKENIDEHRKLIAEIRQEYLWKEKLTFAMEAHEIINNGGIANNVRMMAQKNTGIDLRRSERETGMYRVSESVPRYA